jgi:hypothetical protein
MRLPIGGDASPNIPIPNHADPDRELGHQIERFGFDFFGMSQRSQKVVEKW